MQFSDVRGFNYQPSYEAVGYAIWTYFQPDVIARELSIAKGHFPGMNTIRVWLSFDAFLVHPKRFCENFETWLSMAAKEGLGVVPVLFNNWNGVPQYGSISDELLRLQFHGPTRDDPDARTLFSDYLDAVVSPHRNDERILAWDLCNEPENNGNFELTYSWLAYLYRSCKKRDVQAPIGVSIVPDKLDKTEQISEISDVLMIHPYFCDRNLHLLTNAMAVAERTGKDILTTECCWGSLDDNERVEIIRRELGPITEADVGFLCHLLYETPVADGHRKDLGPVTSPGYMAFIHRDGTLRAGHEVFREF